MTWGILHSFGAAVVIILVVALIVFVSERYARQEIDKKIEEGEELRKKCMEAGIPIGDSRFSCFEPRTRRKEQ